eukprot:TRINITY_DN1569_c8_g1_i1.p1 TRINITY_DN1569_c8_g1~~TRINITY_DN1569_c8_g1_i1.p1  ORF type:complete len:186 (-),score=51.68 TRINITY_DN1569_c8_g1_i1:32-589(-)
MHRNVAALTGEIPTTPNQEDLFNFFAKKRKFPTEEEKNKKPKIEAVPNDWAAFYRACYSAPNLSGIWKASYGIYGEEYVKVIQKGHSLEAVKITGDPHVPAGKNTFKVTMDRYFETGKGEIHLAEANYKNPRWGEAWLLSKGNEAFDVTWPFQTGDAQFLCTLYFTKENCEESIMKFTTPSIQSQ